MPHSFHFCSVILSPIVQHSYPIPRGSSQVHLFRDVYLDSPEMQGCIVGVGMFAICQEGWSEAPESNFVWPEPHTVALKIVDVFITSCLLLVSKIPLDPPT